MENKNNHVSPIQAAWSSIGIGIVGFGACCLFLSWGLAAEDMAHAIPWLLAALFAGVVTGFALALIDKDQAISRNERHLKASGDYDEVTSRAEVNLSRAALLAPPKPQTPVANIMPPKPMVINSAGKGATNRDLFGVGQSGNQAPAQLAQPQWRPLLPAGDGEALPEHYESLPTESDPVLVEPKWVTKERKATAKSAAWANTQDRINELAQMIFARVRYYDPTTANILRALGPAGPGRLITGTSDITAAMQRLAAERGKGGWPLATKRGEGPTCAWRWVNQTTGECEELGDKSPSPAATIRG